MRPAVMDTLIAIITFIDSLSSSLQQTHYVRIYEADRRTNLSKPLKGKEKKVLKFNVRLKSQLNQLRLSHESNKKANK